MTQEEKGGIFILEKAYVDAKCVSGVVSYQMTTVKEIYKGKI